MELHRVVTTWVDLEVPVTNGVLSALVALGVLLSLALRPLSSVDWFEDPFWLAVSA